MKGAAAFAALLALGAPAAAADRNRLVQELFLTDDSQPQQRGELEAGAGVDYAHDDREDAAKVPFTAEWGLTDRLEIDVEAPFRYREPDSGASHAGPGDVAAGLSFGLLPDGDPNSFTVFARQTVPTGDEDDGLGRGTAVFQPGLAVGRRVGYGEVRGGGELTLGGGSDVRAFAAGILPVRDFRLTLETEITDADDHLWRVAPGVFYRPVPGFEAGIGIPVGLSPGAPDLGFLARMTVNYAP